MKNVYINPNPNNLFRILSLWRFQLDALLFLNESPRKQQKCLPRCRSHNAEDIRGTISAAIFLLVGTDVALMVTK